MLLGEWWIANPSETTDVYEPPDPAERVPGALREVARDKFVLETIGFLGELPSMAGGPVVVSDRSLSEIWGSDRNGTRYSLFDTLRSNTTRRLSHMSDGHEDWYIGWLAKGKAWVTSEEECTSLRIRIDDLHKWALHRGPDNVDVGNMMDKVMIDLRDETMGMSIIGDTSVSLVRDPRARFGFPGQDTEEHFSFANIVYWNVEGPVRLREVVEKWIGPFESFIRFMTMEPSVVNGIECSLSDGDNQRDEVELVVPRLPRADQTTSRESKENSPLNYLATVRTLQELGINPMDVFAGYWRKVATGDAYMAMALHLESQDRLLSRGSDAALLNAIRSVESLYAATNPGVSVKDVSVQEKVDDAVSYAGDVGTQILNAWPELCKVAVLRREVAHGKGRPSAGFGVRCRGGAMALQWIQRLRLLAECGIDQTAARSIVLNNFRYPWDLQTLQNWSTGLSA